MPGTRCRTMAIPQRIPNAVLSGTVISVTTSVSLSACTAAGFEIAAQNGSRPCSNARQKMSAIGATRITARYASDPKRIVYLAIMARCPPPQAADAEEDAEGHDQHEQRKRGGALRIATRDPLRDVERRDLRLERQVAADQDDRAELADRPCEREREAGQQRRQEVREDDFAEDREA